MSNTLSDLQKRVWIHDGAVREGVCEMCKDSIARDVRRSRVSWNANQRLVCDCVSKSSIRALRRELIIKLNSKIFELDPGMDEKLSYNAVKDFPEFAELLVQVMSRGKKAKKKTRNVMSSGILTRCRTSWTSSTRRVQTISHDEWRL